ncbi:hypothetical protein [Vibrio cincinnatiensis]
MTNIRVVSLYLVFSIVFAYIAHDNTAIYIPFDYNKNVELSALNIASAWVVFAWCFFLLGGWTANQGNRMKIVDI